MSCEPCKVVLPLVIRLENGDSLLPEEISILCEAIRTLMNENQCVELAVAILKKHRS
jgi:hypothetical protein